MTLAGIFWRRYGTKPIQVIHQRSAAGQYDFAGWALPTDSIWTQACTVIIFVCGFRLAASQGGEVGSLRGAGEVEGYGGRRALATLGGPW